MSVSSDLRAIAAEQISRLRNQFDSARLPGVAIGLAIGDQVIVREAFGVASIEAPLPLTVTTKMRIASVTKHFVAFAYLMLCEKGAANLDDVIGKHVSELHPDVASVPVHALLAQVSGLKDSHDLAYYFSGRGRGITSGDLLGLYTGPDMVSAPPYVRWDYVNGNYLLVSVAIERITRMPLEEALTELIFQPIGMSDTMLRRSDRGFVTGSATLHTPDGHGNFCKDGLGAELAGEGGIVSTVDDMLRWACAARQSRLSPARIWDTLAVSGILRNGTNTGYGLGLISETFCGHQLLSHSGNVMGGTAWIGWLADRDASLVVMANRSDVSSAELGRNFLACLAGVETHPLSVSPTIKSTYWSPDSGDVLIFRTDNEGQVMSVNGYDIPIESNDGRVFRPRPPYNFLKCSACLVGDDGQAEVIEFEEFGAVSEFRRVTDDLPNPATFDGIFRSVSHGIELCIESDAGRSILRSTGPFGRESYDVSPVAGSISLARTRGTAPWSIALRWSSSGDLIVSTHRTRNLHFSRVG